jgi:hypothetical protein
MEFEKDIADGFLDREFEHAEWQPRICGIELQPLGS